MSIQFKNIENKDIFTRDFSPLVKNNEICFPSAEEIVVIYGPNGTGKTSLIKVLADAKGTRLEYVYDDKEYQSGGPVFHIINDQNNRNIIAGETREFFLGDNIRHEFELQDTVEKERNDIINAIINVLKKDFGISAANSLLIELLPNELQSFVKDCANSKSKGKNYTTEALVKLLSSLSRSAVNEFEEKKLNFLKFDLNSKASLINSVKSLLGERIAKNIHVHEIEENSEAIKILSRFHKSKCIVCDNDEIDWNALLSAKTANREATINALDERVKNLIERVIDIVPNEDPFNIKGVLLGAIETGNIDGIKDLCEDFLEYASIYSILLENSFFDIFNDSELSAHYSEYQKLISTRPSIEDEDYLYIKEIIGNSMSKPLSVERDSDNRLRIFLSNQEFLGKDRAELPLSTGEQNFLSLTFEFLKAKNSSCPIVVIDDPVSSFDSIYKNKVVYAIVKMLHHKKRIVLTHNTDLIRLLDGQYKHCFKLYLLNNTDGEVNGFIPLKTREQDMLISLEKLLNGFRENVPDSILNADLFLISMIPFMRGYSNIIGNKTIYESLTQVMHGYKTTKVDIGDAYCTLFGKKSDKVPSSFEISVPEILSKTIDGKQILNTDNYPLLNKTLKHSFTYLFLRLMVEKHLVEKFNIDTSTNEQLGQIISAAYPDENDIEQIRNRIRLTSKKTLINEFNHFEGNLSIFQPAIDITDQALGKERTDLNAFITALDSQAERN